MLLLEQLAVQVVERWGQGDLAEAVRHLAMHLAELKQGRLDHECTIIAASANYVECSNGDISIDEDPVLDITDNEVWVSAWVRVPIEEGELPADSQWTEPLH